MWLGENGLEQLIKRIKRDIKNIRESLSNYLPLSGGTLTGPIFSKSHIYNENGTFDIDLDGEALDLGIRGTKSDGEDNWISNIHISISNIILKVVESFRINASEFSFYMSPNGFSYNSDRGVSFDISTGESNFQFREHVDIEVNDEICLSVSDDINIKSDDGKIEMISKSNRILMAADDDIRLIPGNTNPFNPPDDSAYVKTGNIQGVKTVSENKPSITNFGKINSDVFNANAVNLEDTDDDGYDRKTHIYPSAIKMFSRINKNLSLDCSGLTFLSSVNKLAVYGPEEIQVNNMPSFDIKQGNFVITFDFYNKQLKPFNQSLWDLGSGSYKWKNIYATNGTIQTSDRTKKTDVTPLSDDLIKVFIMGLIPSSYGMIDGTSGRTHWGLISQDIEELMKCLGMDSKDFAGFIKSPKIIIHYKDENGEPLENPIEEVVEGEYEYSLRYDEFIAPLIKMVQMQQKEIESLKADKSQLEARLAKIEEYLGI